MAKASVLVERTRNLPTAHEGQRVIPLFLGIAAFTFAFHDGFSRQIALIDWSDLLDRTYRITLGQVPYRDFFCHTTPGTYWIQAAIWKVFGDGLTPMKTWLGLMNAGVVVTAYLFARNYIKILPSVLIACVMMVWSTYFIQTIPWYDSDAVFLAALSGIALVPCVIFSWTPTRPVLAGVLAGLSFCCKQNTGLAAIGAGTAILLVYGSRWKASRFLAGAATVVGIMLAYLWTQDALPQFFEWTFLRIARGKAEAGVLSMIFWPVCALFYPNNHTLKLIVPLYGLCLWLFWRERRTPSILASVTLFSIVCDYGMLATHRGCSFPGQMILLFFPLVYVATKASLYGDGYRIAFVVFCCVMAFLGLRLSLYRMHWFDFAVETDYAFTTPKLRGAYFSADRGARIDHALTVIEERIPRHEPVFIYPEPMIGHWVLNRPAPHSAVTFCSAPEIERSDQGLIIWQLEATKVQWALLWRDQWVGAGVSPDAFPEIMRYLATRFTVVEKFDQFELLKRHELL